MKPEAQRIAIAEACGWRLIGGMDPRDESAPWCWWNPSGELSRTDRIPDYLNDLNAMQGAQLTLPPDKQRAFGMDLAYVLTESMRRNGWRSGTDEHAEWLWNATAAQRAEAFLRTIGKWMD